MFLSKKRSEMDVFCFEEVANSGYNTIAQLLKELPIKKSRLE